MPKNWATLTECYIAAIPFFWTTLAADLGYTTALFASFFWLKKYVFSTETKAIAN